MIDDARKEEMRQNLMELNALLLETFVKILKRGNPKGSTMAVILDYLKLNGMMNPEKATPNDALAFMQELNIGDLPFDSVDEPSFK